MEPQVNETQPNMTPEESKAALGLSTRLSEQMLMSQVPQQPVEAQETPESAPGQELELETETPPSIDPEALKNEIMKEVKSAIKEEIGGLKEMLKDVLNEDEPEEE